MWGIIRGVTYEEFHDLCERRRSLRSFAEKPVALTDVQHLIDLARLAPSVENTQPWRFHVILNPRLQERLLEVSCYGNFASGAAVLIVVACDTKAQLEVPTILWQPRDLEYSCVTAMEHVFLGAAAMGLGSCWVTLQHAPTREILGLSADQIIIGGMLIGHLPEHADGGKRPPRKPIEDLCRFWQ